MRRLESRGARRVGALLALATLPLPAAPSSEPLFPAEVFAARRERLGAALEGAPLVLFSATVRNRNGDVDHDYRQDSDFYYLTGFPEPEAVGLLDGSRGKDRFSLVVRAPDPQHALWEGATIGPDAARERFGADAAHPAADLEKVLRDALKGESTVYYLDGGDGANVRLLEKVGRSSARLVDASAHLAELRVVKDDGEIAALQRAVDITCEALREVMRHCEPGQYEYELEAVIQYVYRARGCPRAGFPSIVGSGPNSCTLHYEDNDRLMEEGDLVVCDIGAEYRYYSADVTRTLPVSGRFTADQAALYSLVLAVQSACIDAVRPGVTVGKLEGIARQELQRGLKALGISLGAFAAMPHGLSHWLGLDVHDECGPLNNVPLRPGMVITIEPGVYIAAGASGVDSRWWNTGIRIEDDVLVTEDGARVLSTSAPRSIEAIEELMAGERRFPVLSGEG